jgi:NADPH:quinone reductase-like Zn-dependent oxidoreductase
LIQISAAGVTPTEKLWYTTTHHVDGAPRANAIPGHEFSGTVSALSRRTTGYRVGDAVFGFNDWFAQGATAEFCLTEPSKLSLKPATLSDAEAAAAPIGLLTAWQGLHSQVKLQGGERILIHGGAGAVGLFAVQLAKLQGAYVIATSSQTNIDVMKRLGADEVLDYRARRFEEAGPVDVIFDTVGGETLDRSWSVLKPGGRLVTIAAEAESSTEERIKQAFFIVEQDGEQLASLGKPFDSGQLKASLKAEVPLEEAEAAYSGFVTCGPEKLVIRVKEPSPLLKVSA